MQYRWLRFYLIALFVAVQVGEKPLVLLDSEIKDESKSAFLFQYFPNMIA
jgi:hypothetical protein